jgi:hypothetical protein
MLASRNRRNQHPDLRAECSLYLQSVNPSKVGILAAIPGGWATLLKTAALSAAGTTLMATLTLRDNSDCDGSFPGVMAW